MEPHSTFGQFTLLQSKHAKMLQEKIHGQWGCSFDSEKRYGYLLSRKNKVHIINRDLARHIDLPFLAQLRIERPGLYFGELMPDSFRLSIEGSQLVGSAATKNVLLVSDSEKTKWLKGEPLERPEGLSESGFVIIAHRSNFGTDNFGTDFLGCGRVHADKKTIANFIPKTRTLLTDD